MPYSPNLCASVQSVGVFVGGYGIPAIPTPPSEFLPQNPLQVCLRKSSHRFHRIHRSFWRRRASHGFHRCTQIFLLRQSFLCVPRILWEDSFVAAIPTLPSEFLPQNPLQVCLRKSSHGLHRIPRSFWRRIFSHRIHRSFWRRRASHGFHRCTQIFLLRLSFLCVPRILWEDSFVAAWVWQGCHTLLICAHPCNLWEDIPHLLFLCSANSVGR